MSLESHAARAAESSAAFGRAPRWFGGVIGCRMTGGGFIPQITQQIADGYRKKTGLESAIFSSRPAGGAGVLS